MLKQSKKQLFADLKADPKTPLFWKTILLRCDTIADLKAEIVHIMDKYTCLRSQLNCKTQWYLGMQLNVNAHTIEAALAGARSLADAMQYEIIAVNGAFFIQSK